MSIVIALPGNESFAAGLAKRRGAILKTLTHRIFPDGETYLRMPQRLRGETVTLVATLARPDEQILRLLFAARGARDSGASAVHLVAPYLAYMRQDQAFRTGEVVSARYFAELLSGAFDSVTTVQPHLHRIRDLESVFTVPARWVSASSVIAEWIGANVERPFIVGPDVESEPWVNELARLCGTPGVVLRKTRRGDREVTIDLPHIRPLIDRRPVIVDDIISSGETMIAACRRLIDAGCQKPVCVGVHALFDQALHDRLSAVASRVVCTDTVPNACAQISILPTLAAVPVPGRLGSMA